MNFIKPKPAQLKVFLLAIWFFIQAFLLYHYGIVTKLEASKYIDVAQYFLQHGYFPSANYYLYSTQIMLIALAIKWQAGFAAVVALQLALNLVATFSFYSLAKTILQKRWLPELAVFLFIINIPYQQYNTFLYTESVFYSLTIIFSSYLLRIKAITFPTLAWLLAAIVLLSITRPTGILFFPATAIFLLLKFYPRVRAWYKAGGIIVALSLFLWVLDIMLQSGGSLDFMLPFKKENIICGVNTTPEIAIKTSAEANTLKGIVFYIFHNSGQFFRLALLKTVSFFGFTRTYYSDLHNMLLVLFYYPFYFLSVVGFYKKIREQKSELYYMASLIMLYWITTLLTCDDWHNRFVLTVIPFFFLIGLSAFEKRVSKS